MALERSSSADITDFTEEVKKYDCLYNKFSKDEKDKYMKMNCWRKVAIVFSDQNDHMEATWSLKSPGSLN